MKRFEALISSVEVDICRPFVSRLVVLCFDVFDQKLFSTIEVFKVAIPEVLLLLKAQAALDRWHSEKGLKDRVDTISKFADMKLDVLHQMLMKHDVQHTLRDVIKRIVSESRIEYRFQGLAYEKDGVELKETCEKLQVRFDALRNQATGLGGSGCGSFLAELPSQHNQELAGGDAVDVYLCCV